MKSLFFILIVGLSVDALAISWRLPRFNGDDDAIGGLRAVWYCPSENRGDMPEEREVEIYYDEADELRFRPDIFNRKWNPLKVIKNMFGKRSSSDVDQCLRSFLRTIPQAISNYKELYCRDSDELTCERAGTDIILDVGRSIRGSKFYLKHEKDLESVENLLPTPIQRRPENPITVPQGTSGDGPREQRPVIIQAPLDVPVDPVVVTLARESREQMAPSRSDERARARLLDYMTDHFTRFASMKDFVKNCPELGDTTGVNANYCRVTMQYNNDHLTRLSQLFSAVRGEHVSVARVLQTFDCLPPQLNQFRDIEDLLRTLDRKNDCSSLENIGDFKLFRKQHGNQYYTTGDYLLKKIGENAFEATLSIDFKDSGAGMSSVQMMSTVRTCLAGVSSFLRGPAGESLSLRVLSPQEAVEKIPRSERPSTVVVNIRPSGTSNDASNFSRDIDCPVITHELLHHLGLCDEYKEMRTNLVSGLSRPRSEAWSCRVVPSRPTIMKNHVEAFNAIVSQQFTCECDNDACRTALRGNSESAEASRRLLMAASMQSVLGQYASYCSTPVYLPTVTSLPDPGRAFTDIEANGRVLRFQNRTVFSGAGSVFQTSRRNVICQCPADDSDCPAAFARIAESMRGDPLPDSCPFYTKQVGNKTMPTEGAMTSVGNNAFTVVTTPTGRSLLEPNHFDKILTGSCMTSPSGTFKRCSEYAYISEDDLACSKKPAECGDDNHFLGVQRQ